MFNIFKKKSKTLQNKFEDKLSKKVLEIGATLELTAEKIVLVDKVKKEINEILKSTNGDTKQLVKFIKIPVYINKQAGKILKLLNEEYFILEQQGIRAILLSLITSKKIQLKTSPMFLLEPIEKINEYFFLLQFYKYYSYQIGLTGFDSKINKKLKQYIKGTPINNISLDEITMLKDAISRDNEASNFVLEYKANKENQKNFKKADTQCSNKN